MNKLYDVIVIGGGVVGSAVARELSRYKLDIAVLEKNLDVCFETSSRNTGVCHGGFAYDPGSLKARLCVEGNRMMGQLSEELGFSFKRCGKVLVGNTDEEYEQLLDYADSIGIEDYCGQDGPAAEESFIPAWDGEGLIS